MRKHLVLLLIVCLFLLSAAYKDTKNYSKLGGKRKFGNELKKLTKSIKKLTKEIKSLKKIVRKYKKSKITNRGKTMRPKKTHKCEKPEMGIIEVTSNGDKTVQFKRKYKHPPIVMLTGKGNRLHATATLVGNPTNTQFVARLIHYNGEWEKGRIFWVAYANE